MNEETKNLNANKCPVCGSMNIETKDTDGSAREFFETCECPDCDAEFTFIYKLVGVDVKTENEGRE